MGRTRLVHEIVEQVERLHHRQLGVVELEPALMHALDIRDRLLRVHGMVRALDNVATRSGAVVSKLFLRLGVSAHNICTRTHSPARSHRLLLRIRELGRERLGRA
jgi:hypothetical protein